MNKLVREIYFGDYNFKLSPTKEIFKCTVREFPDFFDNMQEQKKIKNKKFSEMVCDGSIDKTMEEQAKVVAFSIRMMLREYEKTITDDYIMALMDYVDNSGKNNKVEFAAMVMEVLLLGFTNDSQKPKLKMSMK